MESSDYRARARESLENNWGMSIGVALVAGVLGGLLVSGGGFNIELDEEILRLIPDSLIVILSAVASVSGVLSVVQTIVGGTVQLGYCQYLLKQHDRHNPEFKDLFSQFERFGQGFAQAFLRGLYIALWSLLFIIPGIVKSYSYAMTPFIMAENPEMSAGDAIKASMAMMDGHKGELFILDLSFIGWDLLCILTLNLGHIALNPYHNAAHAAFYRSLKAPVTDPET